jgi:hypothetical protein
MSSSYSTPSTPLLNTPSTLMPSLLTAPSTPMPSPLPSPSTHMPSRSPLTTPSSPFSDALSSYHAQTKINISKHPLLPRLQNCNSPKTILDELRVQAPEFDTKLQGCLTTTVDVLHAFSPTLGKCIGTVHIRRAYIPSVCFLSLLYRNTHPRTQFLLPLVSSSKYVSSLIIYFS